VKTGKLLWYHQAVAHDQHDSDLSQGKPVFSAEVNGKSRELVALSGKDGLLRVLDRNTHEVLYQVRSRRARTSIRHPRWRASTAPGLLAAWSGTVPLQARRANTLFCRRGDWCGNVHEVDKDRVPSEAHYYGGAVVSDPRDRRRGGDSDQPRLQRRAGKALEDSTRRRRGRTRGGVLFTGDMNNDFSRSTRAAARCSNRFQHGAASAGRRGQLRLEGKQYVA